MSEISITKFPVSGDEYLVVWGEFGDQSAKQAYHMTLKGTVDFTILESSPLSMLLAGKERAEIMQNDMIKMLSTTLGPSLQLAFANYAMDQTLTPSNFVQMVQAGQDAFIQSESARLQERLNIRLDAASIGSILVLNSSDEVVYKWERGAAETAPTDAPWTCTYCGSTCTSKFCTNCGAPRH